MQDRGAFGPVETERGQGGQLRRRLRSDRADLRWCRGGTRRARAARRNAGPCV